MSATKNKPKTHARPKKPLSPDKIDAEEVADKVIMRLEKERIRQGINLYQLGKMLDWPPSGLQRVLKLKVKPRIETVILIAKALGIRVSIRAKRIPRKPAE